MFTLRYDDFNFSIFICLNRNVRKTSKSNISSSMPLAVRPNSVNSNETECSVNMNDVCPIMDADPTHFEDDTRLWVNTERIITERKEIRDTPIAFEYISLINDELKDTEDDGITDDVEIYTESTSTKNKKAASNKSIKRRFKFDCLAANRRNCKGKFCTWMDMMYHVTNYHAKGNKKKFVCYLCKNKSFTTRLNVQRHIDSVHTDQQRYQCPNQMCLRQFSNRNVLKRHIDTVHRRLKQFQCPDPLCLKM